MRTIRRSWLLFGILLTCSVIGFTVKVDWSAQSWLDLVGYAVSIVSIGGVLIYALDRVKVGTAFWSAFRWVFAGVATAQLCVHAIEVARRHGYTIAGTIAFVLVVAVGFGWILVLQWIAMTRLADEH
jgi:hypothetical protein